MSVLAPRSEPIEVRPLGADRVYRLRRPRAVDRVRYRAEVARVGGRSWSLLDLLWALREAVGELIPETDVAGRTALVELIDERIGALRSVLARLEAGSLPSWGEEFAAAWAEATELPRVLHDFATEAQRRDTRYARLLADLAALPVAQGAAAAAVLLVEIRHDDGAVERPGPGVADRIPEAHLLALGRAAEEAMTLSEDRKKNLPSPSGSPSATGPSTC